MKKILVIDDQKDNLISIKALLKHYLPGCEVLTALSGEEGMELAIKDQPDTILLDIIMPRMDGYETCGKLKAELSTKHIPIIMLTAIKTDPESRIKGLNTGADAFLSKPFDPGELTAQIKVMLRIKEAEDKLRSKNIDLEKIVLERTSKLLESEEKYRSLYDNAPLAYQSLNEDGSLNDINPAWISTLGYEREEVLGKYFKDFLHPDWKSHFEKNFPAFKERGYVHDVQFKIRHKKGHHIDISFDGCIGYNPDGSFGQTYCVFSNITQQKKAEKALDISKEKYRNLIETTSEGFWLIDQENITVDVNQSLCDMLGYSKEEMIGKTPYDFVDKANHEVFEKQIINSHKKKHRNYEIYLRKKSGKIFPALFNATSMQDANNNSDGSFAFISDITERKLNENDAAIQLKKSEKQRIANLVILKDLNQTSKELKNEIKVREKAEVQVVKDLKVKNTLLQELYHRTKNNMQVISAMLSMHSRRTEDKTAKSTFLEIIDKIKAMSLVHEKLYKSRDLSQINLNEYIQDLINLLKASYQIQHEKIDIVFSMEDVHILIDTAIPLGLILNELISNIFKHAFSPEAKGIVQISLKKLEDDTIILEISDNGVGFPKDFDPRKSQTMGLQTVFALSEYQLKGEITYQMEGGIKWNIKLKDNLHSKRV